eukprot:g3696.t1
MKAQSEAKSADDTSKRSAREAESVRMVVDIVNESHDSDNGDVSDESMPEDEDVATDEAAYHAWKEREVRRVAYYREQRSVRLREQDETMRRRGMTDKEREADNERLIKLGIRRAPVRKTPTISTEGKKKGERRKHYHKGAFYIDDDSMADKSDVRRRRHEKGAQ